MTQTDFTKAGTVKEGTNCVRQICELINASEGGTPTLTYLGTQVGLSPAHLQ